MEETFGVVVALGLAVFAVIFVVNSTEGDLLQEENQRQERVFIDKSYGKLGSSNPDNRVISLGDFKVGEARGSILGYRNERVEISDTLLGGEKLVFRYNATQPLGGNITFEVLGRTGRGQVYVKANDREVFRRSMIATSTPEISISSRYMEPGVNRFEIGVSRNSLFGTTEYSLEEVQLRVNDRKFHDYEDTFQIYSYELEDYLSSSLSFSIRSSVKTSPLRVYINEREVYSKEQVRSQNQFEVTPGKADLHPGANTISFETEQPAEYSIENTQFRMNYLGNVERQNIVFEFDISGSELDYAERDDTEEYISFDYQNLLPSPRPVRVELNDFNTTLIPENGLNTLEVPEGVFSVENDFAFRTNGTYQVDRLRIGSEGEE